MFEAFHIFWAGNMQHIFSHMCMSRMWHFELLPSMKEGSGGPWKCSEEPEIVGRKVRINL